MNIAQQLEAIFDCPGEITLDEDYIFNGVGVLRRNLGNMKAGEGFSSYDYEVHTGMLRIYGGMELDEHGRERPCKLLEQQAILTFN